MEFIYLQKYIGHAAGRYAGIMWREFCLAVEFLELLLQISSKRGLIIPRKGVRMTLYREIIKRVSTDEIEKKI